MLDIRKAIFRNTHLRLFISRLIFCATTQAEKKSRQLFVRPLLSIIAKIKIKTAMISQRIELSEFMAACVIIIIKQMHNVRQREGNVLFTELLSVLSVLKELCS